MEKFVFQWEKLHEIVSAMPDDKIKFSTNEDFLIELNNKQGV